MLVRLNALVWSFTDIEAANDGASNCVIDRDEQTILFANIVMDSHPGLMSVGRLALVCISGLCYYSEAAPF